MLRFWLLSLFALPALLPAQPTPNRSTLQINTIMQGEGFTGYSPEDVAWSESGDFIYFSWNPAADTIRRLFRIGLNPTDTPQRVDHATAASLPADGVYSRQRQHKVYSLYGDLFLLDLRTGLTRRLTQTLDDEHSPSFARHDSLVLFQRGEALFAFDRASGLTSQLSAFAKGRPTSARQDADFQAWLRADQPPLFDVLRERAARAAARQHEREARQPKPLTTIYYGEQRLDYQSPSPDARYVVYRLSSPPPNHRTQVPDFVTVSGFTEPLQTRPKVGSPETTYTMGLYDRQRDTFFLLDASHLDGIYDKPAFLAEYHLLDTAYQNRYRYPKPLIWHGPIWSPDGQAALVLRSLDNKDRWIVHLSLPDGKLTQLDWQHDDAWVGGPGIEGWLSSPGLLGWLPDNRHLYYLSEATGYSHLYTVEVTTGQKQTLTQGNWEVQDVTLSHDGQTFYLTANAEGPHEKHFYRLPAAGGALQRLTTLPGAHEVTLSPDEKFLAIRYSTSNQPWELYLQENQPGASPRRLTHSTTPAFAAYPWRTPEIVYFTANDGVRVPARLYRPRRGSKGGPAVIFVHGAGYLQNVHRWWSTYSREYMFHNLLADNGYTVLDIDYRASSGYGRDWRTAIYRHMGGRDLQDHVDGARYLSRELGVDARRIGIYGGSYGGFITLMALFQHPGVFKCGAALRSVADWAHYNHPYTANILNTPVTDSLAYRRSSPIYYAEGLQDRLLILHGMIDTNVHFQDVVRLSQRLIELGKTNWEMAVFPLEDHGFVEPSSWTDEYRRIFELFQQELK